MRRSHARNRVDLNSENGDVKPTMEPIKFQMRPSSRSNKSSSKANLFSIILTSVIAAIALSSCYYFLFRNSAVYSPKRYSIIIDGGSTGTRVHVFAYRIEDGKLQFDLGVGAMRVNPGLSSYSEDPDGAGDSLKELVEFGKERVPREMWGETEIRLMATAGLRLLDLVIQKRILESCRRLLRRSGFRFRDEWASVITGSDEGVYAWVVANHALGTLDGNPLETTGIIELGGASAQVTFVSSERIPSEFSRTVKVGNVFYNIYSHSFLHFGQNVAFEALRESLVSVDYQSSAESVDKEIFIDPCTPKGYSPVKASGKLSLGSQTEKNRFLSALQSRGNFSECRSAALMLLQKGKEKCLYQHCHIGSTFIPKLQGNFLATENFFHTSKFFGLGRRASLSDLIMAGERFCGEDWSRLRKRHDSLSDDDLVRYCFSSAYIVALLHDSLGITLDDSRIRFANKVGNIPLDWALGAFILQSTAAIEEEHSDWIAAIISDDSPTLLSLVGIAVLLMFLGWSISKWRKPQVKTIYDLEKGRYIVTRVGRG